MRLPDPIYAEVKSQMMHHAPWHLARIRRSRLFPQSWPDWDRARLVFPSVKFLDEAGCGEDFLRFHREMIRHYKWILNQHPQIPVTYSPWAQFPAWLEQRFSPAYISAAKGQITNLIQNGTADELGNFIEATWLDGSPGSNIHNRSHGEIAAYEALTFPNDTRLDDASMGSPDTAHHNEHFWGLHGWIDELFAEWQRAHGEPVDQNPLAPAAMGHGHPMPPAFSPFALTPPGVAEAGFSDETRLFFKEVIFGW